MVNRMSKGDHQNAEVHIEEVPLSRAKLIPGLRTIDEVNKDGLIPTFPMSIQCQNLLLRKTIGASLNWKCHQTAAGERMVSVNLIIWSSPQVKLSNVLNAWNIVHDIDIIYGAFIILFSSFTVLTITHSIRFWPVLSDLHLIWQKKTSTD